MNTYYTFSFDAELSSCLNAPACITFISTHISVCNGISTDGLRCVMYGVADRSIGFSEAERL